jgi:hypothetical protein
MNESEKMRKLLNLVESASTQRVDEFLGGMFNKKQPAQPQQPQAPQQKQQPTQPAQQQKPTAPQNAPQQHPQGQQQPAQGNSVTNSPAFKKWFGQSKIIGKGRQPRRVFHGAGGDIEGGAFRPSKSGVFGPGIYFTTDSGIASNYASGARRTGKDAPTEIQGQVTPVYLRIERPLTDAELLPNTALSKEIIKTLAGGLKGMFLKKHPEVQQLAAFFKQSKVKVINLMYCYNMLSKDQPALAKQLLTIIRKHTDGIVAKGQHDTIEIVAYYPYQVKSAVGNKGTFNLNSASINEEDSDLE